MKRFTFFRLSLFLLIAGTLPAQTFVRDTTFNIPALVDSVNSRSVDYKSRPGLLQLETGERENLAKGRYAYVVFADGSALPDTAFRRGTKLIDGLFSSPSYISMPALNVGGLPGTYFIIDLQAFRTIKKLQIFALFNPRTRPLAFTVYAGKDTVTMDKVFQTTDNQETNPVVEFTPIVAKYVKIVVDVLDRTSSTVISEVEVYGEGFLPEGNFISSVRNIGREVNFGKIDWKGNKPDGTDMFFSFRTGNTPSVDTTWSAWSDEVKTPGSFFDSYEPRRYIQYKARLTTASLLSPELDEFTVFYDTSSVASSTDAAITPQYAQILKEQDFTYSINSVIAAKDYGIDTLFVVTPSPVTLRSLTVNGSAVPYSARVTANSMTIVFTTTIASNAKIDLVLRTTPFLSVNTYKATISAKRGSWNPQRVDSKLLDKVENWSIVTVGVPDKLIIRAGAYPNPFTPNNDGVNDKTRFEFFLANINEPYTLLKDAGRKLEIKIYDITGRLVRNLFSSFSKSFAYISDNGIEWDGRDESGAVVRPGVYVYQIFVDSDNGGEYVTKTVVVSY